MVDYLCLIIGIQFIPSDPPKSSSTNIRTIHSGFFLSNICEHFQFTDNSCIVAERKIAHWYLKPCVFMLSIVKSFEIFPKHMGDGFISRSFSLNRWTFKQLKNKKKYWIHYRIASNKFSFLT